MRVDSANMYRSIISEELVKQYNLNNINMEKYLGVKLISAKPMTRGEFAEYKYQKEVNEGLPEDGGFLVKYADGYESWSPKEVFEEAYRRIGNLTFGLAIEALKLGKCVARKGWNGKGMYIFLRPSDKINIRTVVEKVKSLPESVKSKIDASDDRINPGEFGLKTIEFGAYLCMKAADNTIVNGWLASQTDILAEDWCIVE